MESYSITDIGMKRKVNQDYVYCSDKAIGNLPNLFIVADGMGGHNAGDFASKFSVETVKTHIAESKHTTPIGILEEAIQATNELLLKESSSDPALEGMGTTLVVATIFNHTMYVGNVGDSRLYTLTKDGIVQITQDHSLVEEMVKTGELDRSEARFHPNKNVITRALGAANSLQIDYFEVELTDEDIVLMCSDGLSNMLEDEEMYQIVNSCDSHLSEAANELIERANDHGGKDNIAIILVKP